MRVLARALLALSLSSAAVGLVPGTAHANVGVTPTMACVTEDSPGTFRASFGYVSQNLYPTTIPVGSTNYVSSTAGMAPNQGQPTFFVPGLATDSLVLGGIAKDVEVTWTLAGVEAVASWATSPHCGAIPETVTREPDLVGTPAVGRTVTVAGEQAVLNSQTYRDTITWWRGCDTTDPVAVGSGRSYTVQADDAGHRLQAVIDRRDPYTGGGVTWRTACDAASLAGVGADLASVPSVAGAAVVGGHLSLSAPDTVGTAPVTTTWSWESCDTTSCSVVGHDPGYTVASSDVGRSIRAVVSTSNSWGSAARTTAPSATVQAPDSGAVSFGPATMSFTATVGETSATQVATYTNGTTSGRRLAAVSVSGPGFVRAGGDCFARVLLMPGESCTVAVAFAPGAAGGATGRLTIDDGTVRSVGLSGAGTAAPVVPVVPATVGPGSLGFTAVAGTTSGTRTVTYDNTSGAVRRIAGVELVGDGFVRTGGDCVPRVVLAPGETCAVEVAFAPTVDGSVSGALTIDDGVTHTVALSGVATPGGRLEAGPRTLRFGTVAGGGPARARTVTVRNAGSQELTVTSLEIAGPQRRLFEVVRSDCPEAALAPGAACAVRIQMRPGATGPRVAALEVRSSVPGQQVTVRLRGRGR